jgi:hypothetical protein
MLRRRQKADKRRRRSRRSSHRPRTLRGSSPTPKTGLIIYRASRLIMERMVTPWQRGVTGEITVFVWHDRVRLRYRFCQIEPRIVIFTFIHILLFLIFNILLSINLIKIIIALCPSFDLSPRLPQIYPSRDGTPLPPRDRYKRQKHRSNRYHLPSFRYRSKTYPRRLTRLGRRSPPSKPVLVVLRTEQWCNSRSYSVIAPGIQTTRHFSFFPSSYTDCGSNSSELSLWQISK